MHLYMFDILQILCFIIGNTTLWRENAYTYLWKRGPICSNVGVSMCVIFQVFK